MRAASLSCLLLTAALAVTVSRTAQAQDHVATDEPSPAAAVGSAPAWPSMDVGDLWRKWRPKDEPAEQDSSAEARKSGHFVVVAPAIGSKPSTGLTLGVNANTAFFQGDPASTHISSMSGGIRVSQKKQLLSNLRFSVFTADDSWFLTGDNRLNFTSLNTYQLGADADTGGAENIKYTFVRLYETAYRTVKPGLFVGGGLNLEARADIRSGDTVSTFDRSAYLAYSEAHGFAPDKQVSTGANVGLLYDTRDNAINASHGWLASADYRTFFAALGGDATWQELLVDLRTYRPLNASGSQRIAFWMLSDMITGGAAPYFDLPTTGGDVRSGRGYSEGRYRGEHLVYGEVEYRGTITPNGLVGFVAFANTSTIGSAETGARLFDAYAPAAGFGFRFMLNKRSRTNLTTDWGFGKDGSRGFYLGIQEAF